MTGPGSQAVGCRWGVLVAVGVLVPFAAFLVWALTTTIHSGGDVALTEISVRDVGGAHTPLIGAYSRYGWHHPGPLLFAALTVPYRVLGTDGSALAAGAVLLNGLAVAGSLVLLWRRGRLGGVVVGGLVIAVLLHSLGGAVIASPWNPVATILPLLLFVLAVWSVTCGDAWMLLVVVGVGSLVVQSHVGTAAVVLVGGIAACVAVVASRRDRRGDRRLWIAAVALGGFLWIAPAIDALRHRGGNLRALVEFWTAAHHHVTGWAHAARIVGAEFAPDPPWITGRLSHPVFVPGVDPGWTVPALAVLFVVALIVATRRTHPDAVRLGWVTVGLALVAWVSVARIVGAPFDYLVRWTELVGALVWLTIAWVVLSVVRDLESAPARRVLGALLGALAAVVALAVTAVTSVRAFDEPPKLGEQRAYDLMATRLAEVGPTLPAPVAVAADGDLSSAGLASSVLNGLVAAGVNAGYPRRLAWQVGGHHVTAHPRTRVLVVYGDDSDRLRADPRYRIVAAADELDRAQRAELGRLRASFSTLEEQVRWTREHPARARRLAELTARSARAVVLVEQP